MSKHTDETILNRVLHEYRSWVVNRKDSKRPIKYLMVADLDKNGYIVNSNLRGAEIYPFETGGQVAQVEIGNISYKRINGLFPSQVAMVLRKAVKVSNPDYTEMQERFLLNLCERNANPVCLGMLYDHEGGNSTILYRNGKPCRITVITASIP